MSSKVKKLTADEQAFWDAAAIAAMAAITGGKASNELLWGDEDETVTVRQACERADRLLTARRERGQQ